MRDNLNIQLLVTEEWSHYLESSARMRGVSRTRLLRRVLEVVLDDQILAAVLDDAKIEPGHAPRDRLFT